MEITGGILFAGLLATTLVQWLKNRYQLGEYPTLALVAAVSLVGAFAYSSMVQFGVWESFLGILSMAGAIYTFIFARFEGKLNVPMFADRANG